MLSNKAKRLLVVAAAAAVSVVTSLVAHADGNYPLRKTNINLAVAANFYGIPPSNSAITDIINAFESENPTYTVTVEGFSLCIR
jgi:ABC-type glycerol-3-phosphate transport system substrate-binding protein